MNIIVVVIHFGVLQVIHMELGWLENMSCSVVLVGVREVGGVGEVSVFCVVSEVNI